MRMNSPGGKSILALVRGGAFAHAGEAEAIELTLGSIPKDPGRAVLDAGCGLGGTADYVTKHGWGRVTGFDIDAVSIETAKTKFPDSTFVAADAVTVGQLWQQEFDLIYCFNSVYAFPQQKAALAQFATTARPDATLVIFEYTDPDLRFADSAFCKRADATFWHPLHPSTLEAEAASAGWNLQSFNDITPDYLRWYTDLVKRIESHRDQVVTCYSEETYLFVLSFYSDLRDAIAGSILGGGIFTFRRFT